MESVLLGAFLNTVLPKIREMIKDWKQEKTAINIAIGKFRMEAQAVQAILDDVYSGRHQGVDKAKLMRVDGRLKVLCQDTQYYIHQFLHKTFKDSSTEFAAKIQGFNDRLQKLGDEAQGHIRSASSKPPVRFVTSDKIVDRLERLTELQELVRPPRRGSSEKAAKVISIVGFAGLGKTLLAEQFYYGEDGKKFQYKAWVTAAGTDEELVKKILIEIDREGNHADAILDLRPLCRSLWKFLRGKEYLIVIDDMKKWQMWNAIKYAFENVNSIVLVTTTIQAVANTCSQGINGYMYRLAPLDKDLSLRLFKEECGEGDSGDPDKPDSHYAKDILDKCDGLPLAIVNVANYLQSEGLLTSAGCKDACRNLGTLLVQEDDLEGMQWVLMNKYTGLTGHAIRSCLLYFCMYKQNMAALPRRNSLMRRWQAEGFVDGKTGCKYLETLVDRNIIQPMEVGTDGAAKRCRPPGMMAEYVSQISMSEYFAALVSDLAETSNKPIRRLYFDGFSPENESKVSGMDLSFVLTLTISGVGPPAIMKFEKYELIAVLDLKGCENLNDEHVKYICKLVLLKYLSLGKTIGKIPLDIKYLKLLETLEMGTTDTVKVHREVFKLPKLRHLIGRFMLIDKPDERWYASLEQKSVLETITGFVTKIDKGFPKLMCHMRRLRKVKICCSYEADDMGDLTTAVKEFIHRDKDNDSYSLSIDFNLCTFLVAECLQDPGSLTSLKLRGDWRPFLGANPDLKNISGITKLCLSGTHLSGNAVLACLIGLVALEYLKLEEETLGPLTIESGTLQQLRRLCLVGVQRLKGITIQDGALPRLVSLHLMGQVIGEGVQLLDGSVQHLREIALDSGVTTETKQAWKRAAKDHPNRPAVLLLPPKA